MRSTVALFAALLLSIPTLARADTLRCGTSLVSEGDSKTEVLARCGEPVAKETHLASDSVTVKDRAAGLQVVREHAELKTIEEWTYNFGPNGLIQFVMFENGKVISIRSGNRGL